MSIGAMKEAKNGTTENMLTPGSSVRGSVLKNSPSFSFRKMKLGR